MLPRLGFVEFEIKHHRGKEDLITNLDKIVPTLSKPPQQKRIIVIIDQDKQGCKELKTRIVVKMQKCACDYKVRIACYELESWFLGDMDAIAKCSPQFKPKSLQNKKKYRNIDSVEKPSNVIEKIVPQWKNDYASKPKFAEKMAKIISLEPRNREQSNRSHSFHVFLETLKGS